MADASLSETPCDTTCDTVDPSDSGAVALLIKSSAAKALASLAEIRALVEGYDNKYQATERALALIQPRIEQAQQAFQDISNTANKVIEDLKESQLVEVPVKALSVALARANATLDAIVSLAKQYDEKLKLTESLMSSIGPQHQRVRDAITDASCYATAAAEAATSQLQGVHAVISEQGLSSAAATMMRQLVATQAQALQDRFKISENMQALAQQAAQKGASLANKYEVPDKISAASSAVQTAVETVEERYAVSERMTALDERVTGGRMGSWATAAFTRGLEMATWAATEASGYAADTPVAHCFVYKLLTQQQHDELYASSDVTEFAGVEIDKADGFVHLSHASELIETARRYYAEYEPCETVCMKIQIDQMPNKEKLAWEASCDERAGLFPHLYSSILLCSVVSILTLPEISTEWLED